MLQNPLQNPVKQKMPFPSKKNIRRKDENKKRLLAQVELQLLAG
jgi:hypothetical protein